uniref:EF-hand domain-containing protein n=1 Tax=Xenopus tropicalis TaxID=8364 RepID=A0A1B8YA36_XENTR
MSADLRKRKKDTTADNDAPQEAQAEEENKKEKPSSCRYRFLWKLLLGLLLIALLFGIKIHRDNELVRQQEAALRTLGAEGLFLFSSLDTDNDMHISPEEFKPISEKLTGISTTSDYEEEELLDPNGETLSVASRFQPLLMETMTKSKDGFLGITHSALSGLRNWTTPVVPNNVFYAGQFKAFLPPKNKLEVGNPWWIIPSELSIFTGYLPNNRIYPPPPKGKEVIIHKLLSMFHPRPFIKTRFAPQGSVACIRAISDFYYDIVFRIHAEFQLNEPPNFPFWFSPGQFTGNIVISKDAAHVRHFKLFVPNNRTLNVDMEWLYGASESSNMEVDIGYLPQMEIESLGPSIPSTIYDENGNIMESRNAEGEAIEFVFEDINWQSEMTFEEAARKLEVTMYPFKRVSYYPFPEAFDRALAEKKLVHSTVLESLPVLALLNESFISTWSLVKELEELQSNKDSYATFASLHLEKYNFPVEMMICLPNGTVVHHINANYFLDITSLKPDEVETNLFSFSDGVEDLSTVTYIKFLKEGLEKAKPFLHS